MTLFTDDVAAATTFYVRSLGLDVVFRDDVSVVLQLGELLVNLLDLSQAPILVAPATVASAADGCRVVLTIPVPDVDETCRELTAQGVTLLNGPMDRPWGIRTASFQDPSGHVWEIAHDL